MTTATDNFRRWDGSSRGHYEVWYLTLNDPRTRDGYWIRYTLEAPHDGVGEPYAQMWFARFSAGDPRRTFGINRKLPIASLTATTDPFAVAIGANRLTHDGARGAVSGDGHAAEWDLRWTPSERTLRQLPSVMYARGGLGETTVLSPNVDVAIHGSITVDGERFELAAAPGGQTHLWGKKHAHAWGWGHGNAFDDHPGAALEVLAVRLKRGGVLLPPMTVCTLRLDGEDLAFTRFDQALLAPTAELGTGRFWFSAGSLTTKVEGEFSCRPEDLVRAHYHDPDGEPSYCHNSCVADLRVTVFRRSRGRWREDVRLLAPRRGHFEIAARTPDPAVTNEHVTVD
ncbi:MAG TPA: hypothetical protein VM734_03680 [Kofleriaceae bacterium]|jgi:hypothetical protein|nr:hypothetical protein [Kofleriaceae bacterium]